MRIIDDGLLCCFRRGFVAVFAFQGPCRSCILVGSRESRWFLHILLAFINGRNVLEHGYELFRPILL